MFVMKQVHKAHNTCWDIETNGQFLSINDRDLKKQKELVIVR